MLFSDKSWMNWMKLGGFIICIPMYATFPEKYQRYDIDTETPHTETPHTETPHTETPHTETPYRVVDD